MANRGGRESGRLKVQGKRRILDDATRQRRATQAVEALYDNFHDDPHGDLVASKKAPKFQDTLNNRETKKSKGADYYKFKYRKTYGQMIEYEEIVHPEQIHYPDAAAPAPSLPKREMTQHQLDGRNGYGPPWQVDNYLQQVEAVFENETQHLKDQEWHNGMTPEPTTNPLRELRAIAAQLGYTAGEAQPLVRANLCDTAVIMLAEVARWLLVYAQIVKERDDLLKRQETGQEERDQVRREVEYWKAQAEGTRTISPQRKISRSEKEKQNSTEERPPSRGKSPPGSTAESSPRTPLPTPRREPIVVLTQLPDDNLHRCRRRKLPTRTCPVCQQGCRRLIMFRCPACKEFFQRMRTAHKNGKSIPKCQQSEHVEQRKPAECAGCRRYLYEVAWRVAHPGQQVPIPSVVSANDAGFISLYS